MHPPPRTSFLRDPDSLPPSLAGPVVAMGSFDGVHAGHRAVIARAQAMAAGLAAPTVVLTFDPHPRRFFAPGRPLFELSPEPLKSRLLGTTGVDGVVVLTFDRALADTSADDFAEKLLAGRLGARGVVVGYDFHYGRGRAGSPPTLIAEGGRFGFAVEIVAPHGGEAPVSSTRVRALLGEGRVAEAAGLLGGRWCAQGLVAHGDKRGRELGFPTANLGLPADCGLAHGIYAVRAGVAGTIRDGVASFGRRPTFDDGAPRLEVFLFDFAGDLYGEVMTVEFVARIRGEEKFDGVAALVARMAVDVAEARRILATEPAGVSWLDVLARPPIASESASPRRRRPGPPPSTRRPARRPP